ncbi:DUF1707 domain-containing protein [uncultured Friedmanniella sp.]|uniref:DUF1707 SHOCT-like domain-containing protein n=1 Tax=uncultured Friedmanniella sp. TaxID=335381 RepID=UPI0035C9854B
MTESILEPAGVGPVAGGHLRASDSDREQVSTVLSTAYAEGRLTREEHDERLDALLAAKTFDDLVGLTRDLVGPPLPTAAPAVAGPKLDTVAASEETDRMVAVFSGTERKGTWRVRRRIESYALFGGIDLDMREATFESPVTEISGFWCFGGLDIKVPAGVEVRDQTMGIFGGSDVKNVGEPQPGAPVLVIKGMALFGGVSVKGPRPARRWGANAALGRRADHRHHH